MSACMRVCMQGSDFHVPGQIFRAQPGGQVGGGGDSLGIPGGRGPLGGMQAVGQTAARIVPGASSSGQSQTTQGPAIQLQPAQRSAILHNLSPQEMGKQTHLQTQPPPIQQVYVSNSRSGSQPNFYTTGPRPQQPRNMSHRTAQSGNQSQVVGMPGVGAAGGPTTIFTHPNIPLQPSTMFVPGQVSGLNPHQQNVYPLNNQMPMQYSGPPQRHQTHQTQYPYQTYQPHHALLAPSSIFGFQHGAQHPGYFYQQSNAPMNLSRTATNPVGSNNQHISGTINSNQGTPIVHQVQQPTQQPQALHSMSIPLNQSDVFSGYNGGLANVSARTKRVRNKAIKDIVNPDTGENISAEIYKDEAATTVSGESSRRESPQSVNSGAELIAEFAARVAILASEGKAAPSEAETPVTQQNISLSPTAMQIRPTDRSKHLQYGANTAVMNENKAVPALEVQKSHVYDTELQSEPETKCKIDEPKPIISLPSTIAENILSEKCDTLQQEYPSIEPEQPSQVTIESEEAPAPEPEIQPRQTSTESIFSENVPVEVPPNEVPTNVKETSEIHVQEKVVTNTNTKPSSPPEQIEEAHHNTNGEASSKNLDSDLQKSDLQTKVSDGKTMQKQRNKGKLKNRESSRKGAEKEGSGMEAIVNPNPVNVSTIKIDTKQDVVMVEDNNKGGGSELTKDIKEKDNYESKKDKDIPDVHSEVVKTAPSIDVKEMIVPPEKENLQKVKNNKEVSSQDAPTNRDVVDCIATNRSAVEKLSVPFSVAQRNEENNKVSGIKDAPAEELKVIETPAEPAPVTKAAPSLKYTYQDGQWSPLNTAGKKIYGREFLMKLQFDPNSKIKPSNLPDLDVVLKDNTKIRSPIDSMRFKDSNNSRHESLFPVFVKSSSSSKVQPPNKRSQSGKFKSNKQNVIHLSLPTREDVKLRETENAWKPTRLVQTNPSDEQAKADALYKRVRSVLNKLTPQKFATLVNQVRDLEIDTQERLQGVIDLVFEKAVNEPNFSVAYALMCKELSSMKISGADSKDSTATNFRKLLLTRCQTEFQKNTVDESARSKKLKEIEECPDPEKKKELQLNLEEEERRIRMKSVGNIRFIGELFKQTMITSKIMHECIQRLLAQPDEENLECLCKLLTTIGKVLDVKNNNLNEYFKQMQQIASQKGKVSSRIRFMLQDVIELKSNNWVPRRDDNNPKTIDQITKDAERESLINSIMSKDSRKDDRGGDRKRNRGGGPSEDGWNLQVGRTRQVYSVETSKLKIKLPAMDDMTLGSKSNYQWNHTAKAPLNTNKFTALENMAPEQDKRGPPNHLSGPRSGMGLKDFNRGMDYKSNYGDARSRPGYQMSSSSSTSSTYKRENPPAESSRSQSMNLMPRTASPAPVNNVPQMSESELITAVKKFTDEYILEDETIEEAVKAFKSTFPPSKHVMFMQEIILGIIAQSDFSRKKTSQIFAQLLSKERMSLAHFKAGLSELVKLADVFTIDIPKYWEYFAGVLVYCVTTDAFPLSELNSPMQLLSSEERSKGYGVQFICALFAEIVTLIGPERATDKWVQSGLQWSDLCDDQGKIDNFIQTYKVDFLRADNLNNAVADFNTDTIHDRLLTLLKDSSFDDIISWIQAKVGDKVKDPKFIRALMTAILETSVEQCNEKWSFKVETFDQLQKLIQRFVDADEFLELQCLFAVQAYITKLEHPAGLLLKIVTYLCENNVLSNEAFLAWQKDNNPAEFEGKSVAMVSLKAFFTPLMEAEDISSGDEA